ncbi:MAG: hypothetical protein ACRD2J_01020 [Thermoanaerobaculia bacterium]
MKAVILSMFLLLAATSVVAGPIISYTLEDIPPARELFYNEEQGGWVYRLHNANLMVSYVKKSATEYQVWWSPDPGVEDLDSGGANVYYNRRFYDLGSGFWLWEFDYSPSALAQWDVGTIQVDDVLYDPSAPFWTPLWPYSGFKYVMYYTYQKHPCGGGVPTAGMLYVTFSNDGRSWGYNAPVHYDGNPFAV